jgi:pimeloyl-ACP methyl ester carboxylesterase
MPIWEYSLNNKQYFLNFRDNYPVNEKVVLLIHGLGVDSESWRFQEMALGIAGFRPIIPDLPGFGSSTLEKGEWSIENISEVLDQFIAQLTESKVSLIGISLGGAITLRMLAYHSDGYSKGVLINSFSKIRPTKIKNTVFMFSRLFRLMFLSIHDQAVYMSGKLFPNEEDSIFRDLIVNQITKTDAGIYKRVIMHLGMVNLDGILKNINTPCLMITAGQDSTILPEIQNKLLKKLKICQQIIIPGAGHAVIVQKQDEVNAAILNFLDDRDRETSNLGMRG